MLYHRHRYVQLQTHIHTLTHIDTYIPIHIRANNTVLACEYIPLLPAIQQGHKSTFDFNMIYVLSFCSRVIVD